VKPFIRRTSGELGEGEIPGDDHRWETRGGQPFTYTYDFDALDLQSLNVVGLGSPNRLSHRIAAGHTE
jgi:hypothetical protein